MKVEIDQQDLEKLKFTLFGVKNAVPHVIKRSVNETIKSTISFSAKEIASHYNLTQTRINKDFTPNTQKATFAKPSGAVIAKGKPVSLTTFQRTRQVAKGVSVQIKKDRARWVWRHAFIRVVKNARQAWYRPLPRNVSRSDRLYKVWKRSDKYGVLPTKYRYGKGPKLYRLTGPRIEDEYGKARTYNKVLVHSQNRFNTILGQETSFELSKLQ